MARLLWLLIVVMLIGASCEESPVEAPVPAAPSDLNVDSVSHESVFLSWTDNSDNETGFVVTKKIDDLWLDAGNTGANVHSWIDRSVAESQFVRYRVYSVNGDSRSSEFAADSTVTRLDPPDSLTASISTGSDVALSWIDRSEHEDGYLIERSEFDENEYLEVETLRSNSKSFTDNSTQYDVAYTYRVSAINDDDNFSLAAEVQITTPHGPPAAPRNLATEQIVDNRLLISWEDVSRNEDGFYLEKRIEADGEWEQIAALEADETEWTDREIEFNILYFYRLRAYNEAGSSSWSNIAAGSLVALNINRDAGSTAARQVFIYISAAGFQFVAIANDSLPLMESPDWINKLDSLRWELETGPETKTVYARFMTRDGVMTDLYSDSIEPLLGECISLSVVGEADTVQNNVVTVNFVANYADSMQISIGEDFDDVEWVPYFENFRWNLGRGGFIPAPELLRNPRNSFVRQALPKRDATNYTLYARVKNSFDSPSNPLSCDITVEIFGTVQINDGAEYAGSRDVEVWIEAEAAHFVALSNDSAEIVQRPNWISIRPVINWTLARGEGNNRVFVRFSNRSGAESGVYWDSIDPVPMNPAIEIEDGAQFTPDRSVSVALSAQGTIDSVMLASTDDFRGARWRLFHEAINFILTPGEGTKRVYAKFMNNFGFISDIVSDSIEPAPINGSLAIDGGAEFTPDLEVEIELAGGGQIDSMLVSVYEDFHDTRWTAYSQNATVELIPGQGPRFVYARLKNNFQIESPLLSASILPLPMNPSIVIEEGNNFTPDRDVEVEISAEGQIDSMKVGIRQDLQDAEWEPFNQTSDVLLPAGEGVKVVFARVMNQFGFISETVSDTIHPMPMTPLVEINGGDDYTAFREVEASFRVNGLIDSMQVSIHHDFHDARWTAFEDAALITLPEGRGEKFVYARFMNDFEIVSDPALDSIFPEPIEEGSIIVNQGEEFTNDLALNISVVDVTALEMTYSGYEDFRDGEWVAFAENHQIEIDPGDGARTVYGKFRHEFFESDPITDNVNIDTQVEIEEFSWESDGGDPLFAGDIVQFELIAAEDRFGAETDGECVVGVGDAVQDIRIGEAGDGRYAGEYRIEEGVFIVDGVITATFTDRAGNSVQANADALINIRAQFHEWEYQRTDNNQVVLALTATVDGEELEADDEIGVFTPDGVCCGAALITDRGLPQGLTAWGDDSMTDEIEGLRANELTSFRIWDDSQHIELGAGAYDLAEGSLRYEIDGITVLNLRASLRNVNCHDWWYVRTDFNHVILIQNAVIDGQVLEPGDEIGVFTPEGLCAGTATVGEEGFPTGISAWIDDEETRHVDGFRLNQEMVFRFWDESESREWETEAFDIEEGEIIFEPDGITVLSLRAVD